MSDRLLKFDDPAVWSDQGKHSKQTEPGAAVTQSIVAVRIWIGVAITHRRVSVPVVAAAICGPIAVGVVCAILQGEDNNDRAKANVVV